MNPQHQHPPQFALATLLSAALLAAPGLANAADQRGKVESGTIGGRVHIKISDPDGIAWYKVYDTTSSGAKTGQPVAADTFSCDSTTTYTVKLDATHAHLHHVDFQDCDKNDESWLANKLTSSLELGQDLLPGSDDDDDGFELAIRDVNGDLIVDIVTVVRDPDGATVSVMLGNGDGSFSEPSAELGTLLYAPSLAAQPLTLEPAVEKVLAPISLSPLD